MKMLFPGRMDSVTRRLISPAVLVIALGLLSGRVGNAQTPQFSGQQSTEADATSLSEACYLGGTSPVPNSISYEAQQSDPTLASQQSGEATDDSEDQPNRYRALPMDAAKRPDPIEISAAETIRILQQAPDTVYLLKTFAGQGFGIDPTVISDEGLYNCIRQDAKFRAFAAEKLRSQGYIPAGEQPDRRESSVARAKPSLKKERKQGEGAEEPTPSHIRARSEMPYGNIPSLNDLYTRDVASDKNLHRFGGDMFRLGTGNANQLPTDLPVGPDYVLGPGDVMILNMWGGQSIRIERTVDRQGQIALPEAGTITVSGSTIEQAQVAIQRALNTQFQNERVEIALGRVRTVRVYVVGDVQRPGAYDVSSLSMALNALYAAGGPTSRGSLRILRHYRGQKLVREIDLYDFLLHGVRSDVDRLQPGDTILVPPVGPQVSVAGMVRRPAIYELRGEENLEDVLNLAGGLMSSASVQQIQVMRVEAHQRRTMLSVHLADDSPGGASKLPVFAMQDEDLVLVSPILPYNEQVVYLEGHVFKPGPYAWREGMTVNDLLHSYQDVMPEPAEHAELVRLQPPDFRPETISFNLPELLIGDDPVTLQPFDVVHIFGRYENDPPKVSVYGEVVRPGTYPMSQGMTVAALVRMAGGFRRSAYQEEADLSSYKVENGQEVEIGHSVVAIRKALDGDKSADIALKAGDVVGIRQLTGWNDIGASITLEGEVKYAGTYGIEEGERLSSVLKRAGGFRENAYPAGAILERVQVRQLEENSRQEMIRRIEVSVPSVAPGVSTTPQDQQNLLQAMHQQQQEVLTALRSHAPTGRLVVKITEDISRWENTPADIVVRAGDKLTIPKRPDFVLVSGQVYNATAITYHPGKDAGWYLHQAGGATRSGDKKQIFILRADGSVVGGEKATVFGSGVLGVRMHPGDSILVPEKVIGGSMLWRNLLGTAQVVSSLALTGAVTGAF